MVIFFHAYARWPDVVPYGNKYTYFFGAGLLGVQLFFLISGFVILLTLEKCSGFKEFLLRRWLRLFPAMLFCSMVIFFTAHFFHERPAGEPAYISLLPGLLFIEPAWLSLAIGEPVSPLEGAFWSLYVEFKFYVISGFIYFISGRTRLIISLFALCTTGFLFQLADQSLDSQYLKIISKVVNHLSFQHFGWFAAGAASYVYTQTKDIKWLISAGAFAVYSAIFFRVGNLGWTVDALLVSAFFMVSIINDLAKKILSNKFFQFFGFISYPLYLSHENAMIAAIVKLGSLGVVYPMFIYPLIPISGLCLFSYFCAKFVEPRLKKLLEGQLFGKQILKITRSENMDIK